MLFSEPKIPHRLYRRFTAFRRLPVSVLFSEPKIPHDAGVDAARGRSVFQCSSASRKFLIYYNERKRRYVEQCFSALQRAENSSRARESAALASLWKCFSALQRAENSSYQRPGHYLELHSVFQCSSASRKFLTRRTQRRGRRRRRFQCSSASRKFLTRPSHLRPSIFPTAMITLRHS